MKVDVKVEDDDDDHKITTGSIVTVSTELTRHNMEDLSQAASNGEVTADSSTIITVTLRKSSTTTVTWEKSRSRQPPSKRKLPTKPKTKITLKCLINENFFI